MASLLQHEVSAPTPERASEIAALGPWFHNLHLPDGSRTAPHHRLGDFPAVMWEALAPALPADLTGWSVLDIGCNAGFYSFRLAERGARVTGLDMEPLFLRQARWAAAEFGLADRVEFRLGHVYELADRAEPYDLVLFLGVFYHLRYPLLALDLVCRLVRRMLAFQTLTMPGLEEAQDTAVDRDIHDRGAFATAGWPKMAFIEHRFAGDATNWWAPNHAAVRAMLRSSGMRIVAEPGAELYVCEPGGAATWSDARGAAELRAATGRGSHMEEPR